MSNKVIIEKLNSEDAKELAWKVIERLSAYQKKVYAITTDNGKEFAEHKMISSKLKVDFFFAKPYHSWERGANENINGLIQYIFLRKLPLKVSLTMM